MNSFRQELTPLNSIEPIQLNTDIDHSSIIDIATKLPQHFTQKGLELIRNDIRLHNGIIYKLNGIGIGFVLYFYKQGLAEISWMGVLPEFQNIGIGTQLLNYLKRHLLTNNCIALIVKTLDESVDYQPYANTRSFYFKNGFTKVEVLQHPDNPECERELVLRMELQ